MGIMNLMIILCQWIEEIVSNNESEGDIPNV
jgi:hypothetical protein